jgi:CobQ-like glutamine amidotransferase family enzyme
MNNIRSKSRKQNRELKSAAAVRSCTGPSRAKEAELRRAQGSHVPVVRCCAAAAWPAALSHYQTSGQAVQVQGMGVLHHALSRRRRT